MVWQHADVDVERLEWALESHTDTFSARGFEVDRPNIGASASTDEIDAAEERLGFPIPPSARLVFATITSGVRWQWRIPEEDCFGVPFDEIFSGGLDWSLHELVDQHHVCQGWVTECFPNPDDPYDAVWHRKLALSRVPNGDFLAIDLDPRRCGAIVYLSHDDSEGHGRVLADSLEDLLDRWVPLACPGPEDWQWLPFVPRVEGPIDPTCQNGMAWRKLIGR